MNIKKQRVDGYRLIHSYKQQATAQRVPQELTDNSIQYKSKNIEVIFDSLRNRIAHFDDGDGIALEVIEDSYHTICAKPSTLDGISHFGVGSKIFPRISDCRITLSRYEGMECYSVWDVSTENGFNEPEYDFLDPEEIPTILEPHRDLVEKFIENKEFGTCIILENIRDLPSIPRVFNIGLQADYHNRYHHYLHTNEGLKVSMCYIDSTDKRRWTEIRSLDILTGHNVSSVCDDTGKITIHTWKASRSTINSDYLCVFRNGVKVEERKHYKVGVTGNPIHKFKKNAIHNLINQVILYNSDSDKMIGINTIKTKVFLPDDIKKLAAKEFSKLERQIAKELKDSAPPPSAKPPQISGDIPDILESNSYIYRVMDKKDPTEVYQFLDTLLIVLERDHQKAFSTLIESVEKKLNKNVKTEV
jgi:hypothetical protein